MTGNETELTLKDLDRKHRQAGWNGCGYHHVIRRSGLVEDGRPHDAAGAHVKSFDKYSLGICVVGDGVNFTEGQWSALARITTTLVRLYPNVKVMGHRDCPNMTTKCPGFDVGAWWKPNDPRIDVV
ncbi:lysozyme [uncultured Caudovirales phage]|uniref:Lysozyme n=1 Tax=uncultured Caudovirales phage TaxID=2100421 RepID=A0A6J5PD36_9CAUD|nr:lysozyme [uncultured Caudovirales phage]